MMVDIDFSPRWDRARVWFGEIPAGARMVGPLHPLLSQPALGGSAEGCVAAVEWFRARGANDPCGLLGGVLRPDPGKLTVKSVIEKPTRKWSEPFGPYEMYPTWVGMDSELATAAARGLASLNKEQVVLSGSIEILAAAISEEGSSEKAFEQLGRFFGKVLLMKELPGQEELRKLFMEYSRGGDQSGIEAGRDS